MLSPTSGGGHVVSSLENENPPHGTPYYPFFVSWLCKKSGWSPGSAIRLAGGMSLRMQHLLRILRKYSSAKYISTSEIYWNIVQDLLKIRSAKGQPQRGNFHSQSPPS